MLLLLRKLGGRLRNVCVTALDPIIESMCCVIADIVEHATYAAACALQPYAV